VIETDHLNPITCPEDLEYIIQRIRQSLQLTPYQESLPL